MNKAYRQITSLSNPQVKDAAALNQKEHRNSLGLYIAEGARLVADSLKAGAQVDRVFVEQGQSFDDILRLVDDEKVVQVSQPVMKKICQTKTPQGIAAILKKPDLPFLSNQQYMLVLDRISDPGNMGTIVRTAAACGLNSIIAYNCTDVFSPKCVRSAMSALNFVNVYQCENKETVFSHIEGSVLVCADMHGADIFGEQTAKNLLGKHTALVIGSEAHGLDAEFLNRAHYVVKLPITNIDSLNAAVCASVMLYTIMYGINK